MFRGDHFNLMFIWLLVKEDTNIIFKDLNTVDTVGII